MFLLFFLIFRVFSVFPIFFFVRFFVVVFNSVFDIIFIRSLLQFFVLFFAIDLKASDGSNDILLQNMTLSIKTYRNSNEDWTCWLCFISFINPYQFDGSICASKCEQKKKKRCGTLIFMHKMHATKISITTRNAACCPIRNKFIVKVCNNMQTSNNVTQSSHKICQFAKLRTCMEMCIRALIAPFIVESFSRSLFVLFSLFFFFLSVFLPVLLSNTLWLVDVFFARFIVDSGRFLGGFRHIRIHISKRTEEKGEKEREKASDATSIWTFIKIYFR